VWRAKQWDKACRLVGMSASPRPYDLRHSFASPLAEGRSVHYVARQLGYSPALTLSTYGHLFAEYEDAERIDAAAEIVQAAHAGGLRRGMYPLGTRGRLISLSELPHERRKPRDLRGFLVVPPRGFEPRFPP
jgi:hypothetical protein